MNADEIPIDIHTLKLQDWLVSRRIVPKNIQGNLKTIRSKIQNALMDMPSHEKLIKLLTGTNINYYHCKEIVEILRETEKDTKSVFGTFSSRRMKDWQEIVKLYEANAIYLGEAAQIFVRNINYEVPNIKKQMSKMEQLADDCLKRIQDLGKPEAQFIADHAALLHELGLKKVDNDNLREAFIEALEALPKLYGSMSTDVVELKAAIKQYNELGPQTAESLPILRHLIEFGNTTVYQYIHKEVPLKIEACELKLNLHTGNKANAKDVDNNEIDFGAYDDNGGTSSSVSTAEIIDFGDCTLEGTANDNAGADIDWGIVESAPTDNVEINFDIPVEEYGIVVEGGGGIAKDDQAYTILDSPMYHDRFFDELYELEAFLRMRLFELEQPDASNIMFSLMDNVFTHDAESIKKMLGKVVKFIQESNSEQLRHLFQLKHSPKYADILASKLHKMTMAVEKIRKNKTTLKQRSEELKKQRVELNPVLDELIAQTKKLQLQIENDISKRYKNRTVNLLGALN